MGEIKFGETHRATGLGRLCQGIDLIDEDAEPLISSAMGVNGAAGFSGGLDLHAVLSGLDRIIRILASNQKIGMAIEVGVLGKRAGVLGDTGSEHVGQKTRHVGGAQEVIQTRQTFLQEESVDIEKEVIDILHCDLKVLQAQGIWHRGVWIKPEEIHFFSCEHDANFRNCNV